MTTKNQSALNFKDRTAAATTLRLLEPEVLTVRKKTVRALLGKAKKMLEKTKSEEKQKDLKEAIAVFEEWQAKSRSERTRADGIKCIPPPIMTKPKEIVRVPNLGYKDQATAEGTLKELEGRDPRYQKASVTALYCNARLTLRRVKDPKKRANIEAAMTTFHKFLEEFEEKGMMAQNFPYVPLCYVRSCVKLWGKPSRKQKEFIAAYESVGGDERRLRVVTSRAGGTWDRVRNDALKKITEKFDYNADRLFDDKLEPTKKHLEMLFWAYTPVKKIFRLIPATRTEEETNPQPQLDKFDEFDVELSDDDDDDGEKSDESEENDNGAEGSEEDDETEDVSVSRLLLDVDEHEDDDDGEEWSEKKSRKRKAQGNDGSPSPKASKVNNNKLTSKATTQKNVSSENKSRKRKAHTNDGSPSPKASKVNNNKSTSKATQKDVSSEKRKAQTNTGWPFSKVKNRKLPSNAVTEEDALSDRTSAAEKVVSEATAAAATAAAMEAQNMSSPKAKTSRNKDLPQKVTQDGSSAQKTIKNLRLSKRIKQNVEVEPTPRVTKVTRKAKRS